MLKPVKFCGLSYDLNREVFKSVTRSGKTLEFSSSMQLISYLSSYLISYSKPFLSSDVSVKEFLIKSMADFSKLSFISRGLLYCNTRYMGYFLSCMYLGSFKFQIKNQHNFFVGNKFSWLNRR